MSIVIRQRCKLTAMAFKIFLPIGAEMIIQYVLVEQTNAKTQRGNVKRYTAHIKVVPLNEEEKENERTYKQTETERKKEK